MPVNPLQPKNAELRISVTLDGMTTFVRLAHWKNANSPIACVDDGIVYCVSPLVVTARRTLSTIRARPSGDNLLVKRVSFSQP